MKICCDTCLNCINNYFSYYSKIMSEFKVWDKVRYTEQYLKDWARVIEIPYPFQDTYTIKNQLTRTSYLADWKMPEHKNRILRSWTIESAVSEELLDIVKKEIINGDNK